jgi:hypothetical protein
MPRNFYKERRNYEMEKDNAVRDQKVFVRLGAVLELQRLYSDASDKFTTANNCKTTLPADLRSLRVHKQSLERVIKTLDLPISLPIGV